MRPRRLTRRALLRGGAAGLAAAAASGCSGAAEPAKPPPPDPEVLLLHRLIADKERTIALYDRAESDAELRAFRERHEVHLAELRRRLPPSAGTPGPSASAARGTPAPGATPAPTPGGTARGRVSVARLRDAEQQAADARAEQVGAVSPPLAQLLASIGACEAAHAFALGVL